MGYRPNDLECRERPDILHYRYTLRPVSGHSAQCGVWRKAKGFSRRRQGNAQWTADSLNVIVAA
jgi:hypothetical protein